MFLLFFFSMNCCAAEKNYEMNWISQDSMFLTKYYGDAVSFSIVFHKSILDQLPKKRTILCNGTESIFRYTYGIKPETMPSFSNQQKESKHEFYNPNYHIHKPLIQNNNEAQAISKETVCNFLKQKSVAWYTGAGISASVVPTMQELENSLGIANAPNNEPLLNLISTALEKPEEIATIMLSFYQKCLNGNPTNAHNAIAKYVQNKKNCLVFTENLDTLHEKTGIIPQRIENVTESAKIINPELLKKIDVMLCVGLSYDDRGLLGLYKHHNPKGVIVALCLEKPTYLSDADYFFKEDAQKIIPELIES